MIDLTQILIDLLLESAFLLFSVHSDNPRHFLKKLHCARNQRHHSAFGSKKT